MSTRALCVNEAALAQVRAKIDAETAKQARKQQRAQKQGGLGKKGQSGPPQPPPEQLEAIKVQSDDMFDIFSFKIASGI